MELSTLVLSFAALKVALGVLLWWSLSRGLEVGARIEAGRRERREREAARRAPSPDAAPRIAADAERRTAA